MSISEGPAVKNSIRCRAIASMTAAGLKAVWMWTVPAVSRACRHWPNPPRWNSGRICRWCDPATWSPISIAKSATLVMSAACRSGIAFALPVVPLVWTRARMSSPDNRGRGGTGPVSASPSSQPGGTGPPPPIAARTTGTGTAASTRPVNSASAATAAGSTSASTSASSRGASRQFTKAGVAPARSRANAWTRKSALFFATIATTSPGPIPSAAQPPARRSNSVRSSA